MPPRGRIVAGDGRCPGARYADDVQHRLCLAMCGFLLSVPVSAHLGQEQFGRFPYIEAGVVIGGGTSWGVVQVDEVFGGYGRVCEESFGPAVTFSLRQVARSRVMQGGIDGVEVTTDGGCTWAVLDNELAGTFPNAMWNDPADAAHLLVGTSTIGAENGLWESTDDGDTWRNILPARTGNFFNIAVNDDGIRIAATGNDGTGHVLFLMSADGGATFADVSAAVDDRVIVSALAYDGDTLLLGGLAASTQGFIDRVDFDGVAVAIDSVGTMPRQSTHAVIFKGVLHVISRTGARGELYRQNDSALGFGAVPDGPTECLFVVDDALWGCGKQAGLNTSMFVRSDNGDDWVTDITFIEVHYRACPEGTRGAVGCGTFIETLCGNAVDDDLDGVEDCDDDDCHFNPLCVGAEGEGEGEGEPVGEGEGEGTESPTKLSTCNELAGSSPVLLVLLGLLRRRRRCRFPR